MDIIVSLVAMGGILLAVACRIVEEDRKEKKRKRILNRTNEKPWSRSKR